MTQPSGSSSRRMSWRPCCQTKGIGARGCSVRPWEPGTAAGRSSVLSDDVIDNIVRPRETNDERRKACAVAPPLTLTEPAVRAAGHPSQREVLATWSVASRGDTVQGSSQRDAKFHYFCGDLQDFLVVSGRP